MVPINELDPQLWEATVKALRSHAATGVDAISGHELKMLPIELILELATILCAYSQGFPKWYMAARAIPLPTCWGNIRPGDTRPITILSQTYRLWAKVINTQILSTFAGRCPPDVTGFLRQRDARSAAYQAQWHIEQSRVRNLPLSGVTLDLKKCFNLIDRQRVGIILQRLGVPIHLLQQWLASLGHLERFWELAGQASDLVHSETGLPEGDCWSVTAMIGIAWTWANELRKVIEPIVPPIRLSISAYADNWSWQSNDHQIHVELFRATHRVALCLGLEIDHSKTWQRATTMQGVSLMSTALQANPWPVRLQSVLKAKDLGTPMVYQGRAGSSMLPDRETEAIDRLKRIEWSCCSLTDKIHQIRASVYPVAFHGTEVGLITPHQLENLRNQVVQAVFHKIPSMSSAIAFQLLDENLLGPALFAILLSIKMAQRFLHRCSPAEQKEFLAVAATSKGSTSQVYGPASALKANLLRLGWGVGRDGVITSPHLVPLSLVYDSFAKLQRFARATWEVDFYLHNSQRKSLRGRADISHRLTIRALSKFPGATHVRLARELAGGFQTKEQQSKWDSQVSRQCELCQFDDSRLHRLLECPATQAVRDRFASVCDFEQIQEAEWHETAGINVKAHLAPELVADPLLRYHVLGNQMANDWAQKRSLDMRDPVNAELLKQMREVRQQRQELDAFLQFVAALQLDRQAQLDMKCLTSDGPVHPNAFRTLHNWSLPEPRPPLELGSEAWDGCCWGRQTACHVWRWLSKLQWPASIAASDNDGVGITWLELFVSFCLDQKVLISVLRAVQKDKQLVPLSSWHDVVHYQIQLDHFCQSFASLVQQAEELLRQALHLGPVEEASWRNANATSYKL
ncbi:RNase H domain-containing protein [Durusdinium trenchii]|uniref:RNase H domain-containing protein n=1 Tax=Durusdinium trenchii TaxID=1381693 RepID=A0ABP0RJ16_9DINO